MSEIYYVPWHPTDGYMIGWCSTTKEGGEDNVRFLNSGSSSFLPKEKWEVRAVRLVEVGEDCSRAIEAERQRILKAISKADFTFSISQGESGSVINPGPLVNIIKNQPVKENT